MANTYYTGIGSRNTPGNLDNFTELSPLSLLRRWGYLLAKLNFTLRSGAADGADFAFENGCDLAEGDKEIYLPWEHFNGSNSDLFYIPPEAFEIAGEIYGAKWKYQKPATKKFMARNMMQVMGLGLDEPSLFVLCWTPDGCTTKEERTHKTGGTGQAIAYASELGIPVFNLNKDNHEKDFTEFLAGYLNETPANTPSDWKEIEVALYGK